MDRVTSGWTDRHLTAASAMLTAAVTGGLATLARGPYDLVGIGVVALTVVALSLDAFGGIVAGFAAAAALIAARQVGGDWTPADFPLALSLTVALVALGWLTGVTGTRLRQPVVDAGPAPAAAPAYGSLGLLPADLAIVRLDEEIARARRHRRPLSVVLLSTDITDPGLSEGARSAVQRTVARLVESLVPETAVPFALAADEVGAILPEAGEAAAWELLGPVVDAAGRASVTVREENERRSLLDCAELHAGLVPLSPEHPDADRLIAAVRRAVHARRPSRAPGGAPPVGVTTP